MASDGEPLRVTQARDGGPLRVTQAREEASDGGPPRVFLERKLCKVHAQNTKAVQNPFLCRLRHLEPRHCSMALLEALAASAPPAPGPSSESSRPPMVLWRPASWGRQRQAQIMDAGPGHSGHAVSPGPVAAPTPSSHGRYTAGLCQQFQHPVDPLGLGVGVLRPSRSGGEHPDQPMACLTCRLCSKITSRFVANETS